MLQTHLTVYFRHKRTSHDVRGNSRRPSRGYSHSTQVAATLPFRIISKIFVFTLLHVQTPLSPTFWLRDHCVHSRLDLLDRGHGLLSFSAKCHCGSLIVTTDFIFLKKTSSSFSAVGISCGWEEADHVLQPGTRVEWFRESFLALHQPWHHYRRSDTPCHRMGDSQKEMWVITIPLLP